jgi:hypothetical protein
MTRTTWRTISTTRWMAPAAASEGTADTPNAAGADSERWPFWLVECRPLLAMLTAKPKTNSSHTYAGPRSGPVQHHSGECRHPEQTVHREREQPGQRQPDVGGGAGGDQGVVGEDECARGDTGGGQARHDELDDEDAGLPAGVGVHLAGRSGQRAVAEGSGTNEITAVATLSKSSRVFFCRSGHGRSPWTRR